MDIGWKIDHEFAYSSHNAAGDNSLRRSHTTLSDGTDYVLAHDLDLNSMAKYLLLWNKSLKVLICLQLKKY